MKKVIASLLALALAAPLMAFAHPGGGPGPGWHHGGPDHGGHGWGRPAPFRFLPEAATAVLIGGLTYYLLNGNYYQRQGDTYVVAQPPIERVVTVDSAMRALDYNGRRYYVQDGHYYERNIDGEYLEVPRPPGL